MRNTLITIAILFSAASTLPGQPYLSKEYVRLGGRIIAEGASYFTDLGGQSYVDEANLLYADGITSGTSCPPSQSPSYCGASTLTRDQMAVLIVASIFVSLEGPGQGGNFTLQTQTPYFTDVPQNY